MAGGESKVIEPKVTKTTKIPKTTPTPIVTKAIDWSKIDKADKNILVNNYPTKYPDTMANMINSLAKGKNVSESQALRILSFPSEIHKEGVIQEIQKQLGDDFAHYEWDFATPDRKSVTLRSSSLNDEDVIRDYRLLIITKPNIKAETHIYTFKNGYTVPIQILPIAQRTNSEISAILNDKDVNTKLVSIIKNYGGELQTLGIGSMQVVSAYVYFPNDEPSQLTLNRLDKELKKLTQLQINVEVARKIHLD